MVAHLPGHVIDFDTGRVAACSFIASILWCQYGGGCSKPCLSPSMLSHRPCVCWCRCCASCCLTCFLLLQRFFLCSTSCSHTSQRDVTPLTLSSMHLTLPAHLTHPCRWMSPRKAGGSSRSFQTPPSASPRGAESRASQTLNHYTYGYMCDCVLYIRHTGSL